MQTGVNHQSNGSHHLGGESAEILTGVLVKAHLDAQLLRIQTPSFNVSSTEILSLYIYFYIYLFIYLFYICCYYLLQWMLYVRVKWMDKTGQEEEEEEED
jgi:hypothetical protein